MPLHQTILLRSHYWNIWPQVVLPIKHTVFMWHVCAAPWQNAIISASHRRVNDGAPSSGWRREIERCEIVFVSVSGAGGFLLLITFFMFYEPTWGRLSKTWFSDNLLGCCTYSYFLSSRWRPHRDSLRRDIRVWQGPYVLWMFMSQLKPSYSLSSHLVETLPPSLAAKKAVFGSFPSLVDSRLAASWHMKVSWDKL